MAAALAVAGAGLLWWLGRPGPPPPGPTATAFAVAWEQGTLSGAPWAPGTAATDAAARMTAIAGDLGVPTDVTVAAVEDPATFEPDTRTTARLDVTWDVGAPPAWTVPVPVDLVRDEEGWGVEYAPSLVHPRVTDEAQRLVVRRTAADRGDVLATDGTALVTDRSVVRVGIQPSRVEDLDALAADLTTALSDTLDVTLDPAGIVADVAAAPPDRFVPVVTLREADYLAVEERIFPLPGTVFRRDEIPLAPTRVFARATLGTAGPVTAEILAEDPERYRVGDVVGRSGLQAAYDERLFGTPGVRVVATAEDVEDVVLLDREPEPGQPVVVTLDQRVQRAADRALVDVTTASALVALRPSDGHVLAVANGPDGGGFDLALQGRLPPGSTFKVVTTTALLTAGLDVDEQVPCPAEAEIDGRVFTNAEDEALGAVPFRTDFARSCNTAFVRLSQELTDDALQQAGADLGLGAEAVLGVPAFLGDVPVADGAVDLAAAAIGQGRVVASPLAMATVMASVADGATVHPRLVVEPAPPDGPAGSVLPPATATTLRELTRLVVTEGTATALADVPGGAVHGKTGTAEFARDDGTLGTHAWFVGFRGDLAFAVTVTRTDGGYGGAVAAPVAARFLTELAAG